MWSTAFAVQSMPLFIRETENWILKQIHEFSPFFCMRERERERCIYHCSFFPNYLLDMLKSEGRNQDMKYAEYLSSFYQSKLRKSTRDLTYLTVLKKVYIKEETDSCERVHF